MNGYLLLATFLALTLIGGMIRIVRGPTAADRVLAAQLFGSTGVAILLVLAHSMDTAALRDVALVFALLAPINTVVFTRFGIRRGERDGR